MALEDTVGVPPPSYDPLENTQNLTQASVDPEFARTRMARKGLTPLPEPGYDVLENTHNLTKRAVEMLNQRGPTNMGEAPKPSGFSPPVPIEDQGASFSPPVPVDTNTPATPQQEGGGASASPLPIDAASGVDRGWYGPTIFQSAAKSAVTGAGNILQGVAGTNTDPTQSSLYSAGDTMKKWAEKTWPLTKEQQESFTGRTASNIGGMAAPVAAMAAAAAGGPVAATAAGATLLGLQSAGTTFSDAKAHGASDDDAIKASGWSGAINQITGGIPIGIVLAPFRAVAPALVAPAISVLASTAATREGSLLAARILDKTGLTPALAAATGGGAAAFAVVGELQEYIASKLAQIYYDPNSQYHWDTQRFLAAAATGGLFGAGAHTIQRRMAEPRIDPNAPPGAGPRVPPRIGPPDTGPETKPSAPTGEPPTAGPKPGETPPTTEGPKPGATTAGPRAPVVEPDFQFAKPRQRKLAQDEATALSEQRGDGHTPETIKGWSDAELKNYISNIINEKAGGEKPKAEEPQAQPPVEQPKPEQPTTTAGPRPGTRENPVVIKEPEDVIKAGEETKPGTPAQNEAENHQSGHMEIPEWGFTGKHSITNETPLGGTRRGGYKALDSDQERMIKSDLEQLKIQRKTADAYLQNQKNPDAGRVQAQRHIAQIDDAVAQFKNMLKHGMPSWEVHDFPVSYNRIKGTIGNDKMHLDLGIQNPKGKMFIIDQLDPETGKFDEHKLWLADSAEAARESYIKSYNDPEATRIHDITEVPNKEALWDWINNGDKSKPFSKKAVAKTTAQPSPEPKPAPEPEQPKSHSTAGPSAPRGGTGTKEMTPEEGFAKINEAFPKGGETTKGTETKGTETKLAEDRPSAEPKADIKAQVADLDDENSPRTGVWLPKPTLEHLQKTGATPESIAPGKFYVPDFDKQGGMLITIDKPTAELAVKSADSGNFPLQTIIGVITGAGTGKPADATHVVQLLDLNNHVRRERAVREPDIAATRTEFEKGSNGSLITRVLAPDEVLKRREDLIKQELGTPTTAGPSGGEEEKDINPLIKQVEDALSAAGIDPNRVTHADVRQAAELLRDGKAEDAADAYITAVVENAVDQGYATKQEIIDGFGEKIARLLELNEGRPPVSGGAAAPKGTTAGPSAPRGTKEGGELQGGGQAGGHEGQGQQQEHVEPTQGTQTKVAEPGENAGPQIITAPEPTEPHGGSKTTAGPRGGSAEPKRPEPTHGESESTAGPRPTGGATTGGAGEGKPEPAGQPEPAEPTEPTGGNEQRGETGETGETTKPETTAGPEGPDENEIPTNEGSTGGTGAGGGLELPDGFRLFAPGEVDTSLGANAKKGGLDKWNVSSPGGFTVALGSTRDKALAAFKVWQETPEGERSTPIDGDSLPEKPEIKSTATGGGGLKKEKKSIEDTGEKLRNAIKFKRAGGLTDEDIEAMNPRERVTHLTKEKIWERPDFADMVNNQGVEVKTAALMKRIYDKIPANYHVPRQWTEEEAQNAYVRVLRAMRDSIKGITSVEQLRNEGDTFASNWENEQGPSGYLWRVVKSKKDRHTWVSPLTFDRRDEQLADALIAEGWPNQEPWQTRFRLVEADQYPTAAEQKVFKEALDLAIAEFNAQGYELKVNDDDRYYMPATPLKLLQKADVGYAVIDPSTLAGKLKETWDSLSQLNVEAHAREKQWRIIRKKNDSHVSWHPTKPEAITAVKQLYDEEIENQEGGFVIVRPDLAELVHKGHNFRNDGKGSQRDIDEKEFEKEFGFLGLAFGKSVPQHERQSMLNLAWDALHSMALVMGLSPKAISLDHILKGGFGSNGRGGRRAAAAHYEPDDIAFNMTRMNGAGSLAHEFMHALDHYLGELNANNPYGGAPKSISGWQEMPDLEKKSAFLDNERLLPNLPRNVREIANELMRSLYWRKESTGEVLTRLLKDINDAKSNAEWWKTEVDKTKAQIAAAETDEARAAATRMLKSDIDSYNSTVRRIDQLRDRLKEPEKYKTTVETNYLQNAAKMDGPKGDYYRQGCEMLARAGECWVYDTLKSYGYQNDYLVHGVEDWRYRDVKNPYPDGEERAAFNLLFDELFAAIKSVNGVLPGSKIVPTPYSRGNKDNVFDVLEAANPIRRQSLIDEAIALAGSTERAINNNLSDAYAEYLGKESFPNILAARKFAADRGFELGTKEVEEELELGIVKAARKIVETNAEQPVVAYNELVELYGRQPHLKTRTSESMLQQAYSTPVPLGYLASRIAGVTPGSKVYEPTAGNGALLLEAGFTRTIANEINDKRAEHLRDLGFETTQYDALDPDAEPDKKSMDIVLANPPFGVKKDGGEIETYVLKDFVAKVPKDYFPSSIDHVIALRALDSLKSDGSAVLIVGSINPDRTTNDERFRAYQAPSKRLFYKTLYDNYKVTDHFTVAGSLYEKQGAGWPIDVVVIKGRGQSSLPLPADQLPVVFETWDDLKGLLDGKPSRSIQKADGEGSGKGGRSSGGYGTGGGGTGGGRRRPRPTEQDQPVEILEQPDEPDIDTGPTGGDGGSDQAERKRNRPSEPSGTDEAERRPSGLSTNEISDLIDEAFDDIFGSDDEGTKLSSIDQRPQTPPNFDQAKYDGLVPAFLAAAKEFPQLTHQPDLKPLYIAIVKWLQKKYDWDKSQGLAAKPYLEVFFFEVGVGIIKIPRPKTELAPEGEHQVDYPPVIQGGTSLQVKAPEKLLQPMLGGLRMIQAEVGPLEKYVAQELNVTPEQLFKEASPEQIEALAQAIFNARAGSASINGDMTGIGKGRVGAMLLQWAHRNGKIPVFVTKGDDLYRDMYRDLKDTGMMDYLGRVPRIFATNANLNLKVDDQDESVRLKSGDAGEIRTLMREMTSKEAVLGKYDLVFTSYGQLQMAGKSGEEPERRAFMRMLAPDAVFIFDESHEAAGEAEQPRKKKKRNADGSIKEAPPNRAGFARELVRASDSTAYMSATYAKNPNTMVFYAKTNIRLAVDDPKLLPKLFARGGIPMQQIVATDLAWDGQYLRRERDWKGIEFKKDGVPVNLQSYDDVAHSFGGINKLANYIKELLKSYGGIQLPPGAASNHNDNAIGIESVDAVGFTSILHNAVAQMLLAMKAKQAADGMIASIKRGEKPILGLYNTMESFLSHYVNDENEARTEEYEAQLKLYNDGMISEKPTEPKLLKPGSAIDISFKDILMRYLKRARTVRVKDENGDTEPVYLTDDQIGERGMQLFGEAKAIIDTAEVEGMPISPIDYILNEVRKAGFRIKEISGRKLTVDYSGDKPKLANRPSVERGNNGKIRTVKEYNRKPSNSDDPNNSMYGIHAIIMNQAGSTGLSMHSSRTFDDQSPRRMIIVQPPPDINIHMQMIGRINRTNQANLPAYTLIYADVPAEARPVGLLARKMASLNANVTGARGGVVSIDDEDFPDFMNVYGDKVAAQFLAENPLINAMMDKPLKIKDDDTWDDTNMMHKLTGRLALVFPSKQQAVILDHLKDEYFSMLDSAKQMGENLLEAQVLKLAARPLERTEVVKALADTSSRFGRAVTVDKAKVRRLVKPMSHTDIARELQKTTGVEGLVGTSPQATASNLSLLENSDGDEEHLAKYRKENDEALAEWAGYKTAALEACEDAEEQEEVEREFVKIERRWTSLRNILVPGSRWRLNLYEKNYNAIVLGLTRKGKAQSPLALSTWQVSFATAEGPRTLVLPFSRLWPVNPQTQQSDIPKSATATGIELRGLRNEPYESTLNRFQGLQDVSSEERYIIGGNLLAGFKWMAGRGSITLYTDFEGNQQQGILAPHDFDFEAQVASQGQPVKSGRELAEWLKSERGRKSINPEATVRAAATWRSTGDVVFDINITAKKLAGGQWFLNSELLGIVNSAGGFRGAEHDGKKWMSVSLDAGRFARAIDWLQAHGADLRMPADDISTIKIDTSHVPDLEAIEEEKKKAAKEAKLKAEQEAKAKKPPEEPPTTVGSLTERLKVDKLVLTVQAKKQEAQIMRVVNNAVNHMLGPREVSIKYQTPAQNLKGWNIADGTTVASYDAATHLIELSMRITDTAWMATNAFHEAYHAAENLLLRDQERAVMQREVPRLRQWIVDQERKKPTQKFTPEVLATIAPHEVRAVAFEKWMNDYMDGTYGKGYHIGVRRAFDRIGKTIRRVRNGLQGLGFQTAEDIFENLARGKMSSRPSRTDRPLLLEAHGKAAMIEAWHGSPHNFDKFSNDKIGTGEGAAMYGVGHYFAKGKQVAEYYQGALTRSRGDGTLYDAERIVPGLRDHLDEELRELGYGMEPPEDENDWTTANARYLSPREDAPLDVIASTLRAIADDTEIWGDTPESQEAIRKAAKAFDGGLYKVSINTEEEHMLDWFEPLRKQSQYVQDYIKPLLPKIESLERSEGWEGPIDSFYGGDLYQALARALGGERTVGVDNKQYKVPYSDEAAASKALLDAGITGIKYLDQGSRGSDATQKTYNYVIFDDKFLSIAERNGTPIPLVSTKLSSIEQAAGAMRDKIEDLFPRSLRTDAIEVLSNYSHREKLLQKEIERRYVGFPTPWARQHWQPQTSRLPDQMQFYAKKELMPGRIVEQVDEIKKSFIAPIVKEAERFKIALDELGEYIQAKGAIQRNEQIGKLYRDRPNNQFYRAMFEPDIVGGSGLSENQADMVISAYENNDQRAAGFLGVWELHQALTAHIRRLLVDYGLERRAIVADWEAMGPDYVSYKGFEDLPEDERPEPHRSALGPFGVRGKEFKEATGRLSRADNPLVNIIEQAYRVIERGEMNNHLNAIADTLTQLKEQDIKTSDIASIDVVKYKKVIDKETGLARDVPDFNIKNTDNAVHYKKNGIPHFMLFREKALAKSIKRTSPLGLGWFRWWLQATNQFKAMWTHYSPDFIARHFLSRYMIEGALNLQQLREQGPINTPKWIKDAFPHAGLASRAIYAVEKGETTNANPQIAQLMRYYIEMKQEGGKMAFRAMRDIEGIRQDLKYDLDAITGNKSWKKTKAALRRIAKNIDELLNNWDNATRLATYAQARDQGQTPQASAFKAANATINYRKRGLIASWLGCFLPFSNTAIQTGVRWGEGLLHSKRMRKVSRDVFAVGAGLGLWNYLAGGSDKAGVPYFEKIPHWERALNVIILNPFEIDPKTGGPMAYKLPMPYNFALPLAAGYHTTGVFLKVMKVVQGNKDKTETIHDHAEQLARSVASVFTPLGEIHNWLDIITPEPIRGLSHAKQNKNWLDNDLHIDPSRQKGPASYSGKKDIGGYERTGKPWKWLAETINDNTGGSSVKAGWVDLFPETYKEVIMHPFGAQIRFIGQEVVDTVKPLVKLELPKSKDVPILKVFRGADYQQADAVAQAKTYQQNKRFWER